MRGLVAHHLNVKVADLSVTEHPASASASAAGASKCLSPSCSYSSLATISASAGRTTHVAVRGARAG